MNYYIIVNNITKDIEGVISTSGTSESCVTNENQTVVQIEEADYRVARRSGTGSYYENGTIIHKPANTPYDTWDHVAKRWVTDTQAQLVGEGVEVRAMRDRLLADIDLIISNPLRWADMPNQERTKWTQYRRDLLDVPQQQGFPLNVIWPNPPQ